MLKLVTYPDKRLKMKCKPVPAFTESLKALAKNMGRIMLRNGGVGISAPQVGMMIRLIIVSDTRMGLIAMANPEITYAEGDLAATVEGCLSFPGKAAVVYRQPKIKVKYLSVDNEELELDFDGEAARIIQHEIDHLDGITMVDRNKEAQAIFKRSKNESVSVESKEAEPSSSTPSEG